MCYTCLSVLDDTLNDEKINKLKGYFLELTPNDRDLITVSKIANALEIDSKTAVKCEFDIIDDEELNERIEDLLQYLKKYENSCYTNVLGERRDELQKLVGIKYDHEEKMEF